MNILIGKLGLETNTFSSEKGSFEYWTRTGWLVGDELVKEFRGKSDYLSGMIELAEENGVNLVPTVAVLDAGPLLTMDALDYALGVMIDIVKSKRDSLDGICLALHGAGCAEGIDDLETYTLSKIREIVGWDIPIMMTLDLHANMTQSMLDHTQGIFGIKQYPHTDNKEAGKKAMTALIRYLRYGEKLYQSLVKLPILLPCSAGNTVGGPMTPFVSRTAEIAEEYQLADATVFHGFPYADRAITGMSVLTVSKKSQKEADLAATHLANEIWDRREELRYPIKNAHEAVDEAGKYLEAGVGYVVINETSDNPGGGTACDATGLLKELIKRQEYRSIFGYIHDPEFVYKAHAAGVGNTVSGKLGAKKDKLHGTPVEIDNAYVAALSDGNAIYKSPIVEGQSICYGKSARLVIGNCQVIVVEKNAQQVLDDVVFAMTGADIEQYQIVGLKSSNHFRAWFASRAKAIVTANENGIQTDNLSLLPFENIIRPVFPLDDDVTFNGRK